MKNTEIRKVFHLVEPAGCFVSYCEGYTCKGTDSSENCVCIVPMDYKTIKDLSFRLSLNQVCEDCLNHPKHQFWLLKHSIG